MPSGFLSKFARDKPTNSTSSSTKHQHQHQQPSPLRSPATSGPVRSPAPAAPTAHSSSIDSAYSSTVAGSSAGGSGSSASSSLLAGHQHPPTAQSRTLSSVLDDNDGGSDIGTPGQPMMSLQQNASAEASAGVAMSGIPVVNIQDPQGGARQMSVDAMDVSGLSLTGQANPQHSQQYAQLQQRDAHGNDEHARMRDKMQEAQAQVRCGSFPYSLLVLDLTASSVSLGGTSSRTSRIRSSTSPCCST